MNRIGHAQDSAARQLEPAVYLARLARVLALAYLLVIAYASLQPLRGWRYPPEDILRFLGAPWPRYVTLEDLAVNVAAYVPLGFLLCLALRARHSAGTAVLLAAVLGTVLSLAMEGAQMFLPSRIASNVDLLTNGGGALLGALAAPLFAPSRLIGGRLAAQRRRLFVPGLATDAVLIVAGLWLLTHLHPTAQFAGTGYLRDTFELPAWLAHAPGLLLAAQAAVAGFNLLGLGLMLAAVARPGARPLPAVGALVGAGLAVKAAAAAGFVQSPAPLAWLTPGVALGLVAGALLLYPLARLPRRALPAAAALCLVAGLAAVNLAPDNPYLNVPPRLLAGGASHLLSASAIARALSELWPFLALGCLAAAAARREPPVEHGHRL